MNLVSRAKAMVKLLESHGCKSVFISNEESKGFQTLLYDDNSQTVLSVEIVGGNVEIRTKSSQKTVFHTKEITDAILSGTELSPLYTASDWTELPLISLYEEGRPPIMVKSMSWRLEHLSGAPADPCDTYFVTGCIPGICENEIKRQEEEYLNDIFKSSVEQSRISELKIGLFPKSIQVNYGYVDQPFIKKP